MRLEALEIVSEYQQQPFEKKEAFKNEYVDLQAYWYSEKRQLEKNLKKRFERRNRPPVQFLKDLVFFSPFGMAWNKFELSHSNHQFCLTDDHAISLLRQRYSYIIEGFSKYERNLSLANHAEGVANLLGH